MSLLLAADIGAPPSVHGQAPQVGVWTESRSLRSLVERAKREGRSEVSLSVPILDHTPVPATIGKLLDGKTIIVATAERPQAAQAFVRVESFQAS